MQRIRVTQEDIDKSVCGNRRQCMIANSLKRSLRLDGNAYIRVDENGVGWSYGGYRHHFDLTIPEKRRAKLFDENPQLAEPHWVNPKNYSAVPYPSTTPERQQQINKARAIRKAAQAARGEKPVSYRRFI